MSSLNRKVYIVMAYNVTTKSTFISEVCSSKKKADKFREYISEVMAKHDPENSYVHWVDSARVY
jgi:hypothetical protein